MARLPRAPAERSPRFLGVRAGLAFSAASWDDAAQARPKRQQECVQGFERGRLLRNGGRRRSGAAKAAIASRAATAAAAAKTNLKTPRRWASNLLWLAVSCESSVRKDQMT